ncbi:MAG: hypothetical protein JSU86_04125 [Phycisphaerales bacterium]|nr:MAG: hypothetical protein JSU86_04125 [Phycisphaerales bacterium]
MASFNIQARHPSITVYESCQPSGQCVEAYFTGLGGRQFSYTGSILPKADASLLHPRCRTEPLTNRAIDEARGYVERAAALIEQTGYHRRDEELAELQQRLRACS